MVGKYPSRTQYREQQRHKKKNSRLKQRILRIGGVFFIAFFLIMSGFTITAVAYVMGAPPLNPDQLVAPQSSTIYDMNDDVLFDIAGVEHRKAIPLSEVPVMVQHAFLAVEDARFWRHSGLDFRRIGGALLKNAQEGFGAEGASTITQQLVKLSFLTPEKTVKRKVQEAYLALKLERKYSKEEIFEMYLNKVYFGEGAYGVATAAELYFGKTVDELTIGEVAMLAGLPQRPSGYNPFKDLKKAEERRNTVLRLMEQQGYIQTQEMKEAQAVPLADVLVEDVREVKYRSFIDHVIEELKEKGFHEKAVYTEGLQIYTTIDPQAQEITEKALMSQDVIPFPDEKFKAGVALIDTQTGEIRALGGRRSPEEQNIARGYNYATQLKRQPGSTIKPVMAYGPAIEYLGWTPNTLIKDEPLVLNGKAFRNWNNRYHGKVTMHRALQWSYNIPAIKTMQAVGAEEVKDFAGKLGIYVKEVYPAYALGGFGEGISPLQLAGAFAAFGNEGVFTKPHAVRKIILRDGVEQRLTPRSIQAMRAETAAQITDMLRSVVTAGTGTLANISGLPLAGKTGTTQLREDIPGPGATDAWFVGYTPLYTASVWTGYDVTTKETYIRSQHTNIARLIFRHIMSEVSAGKKTPPFQRPAVVERETEREVEREPAPELEQGEENKEKPPLGEALDVLKKIEVEWKKVREINIREEKVEEKEKEKPDESEETPEPGDENNDNGKPDEQEQPPKKDNEDNEKNGR